MLLNPFRFSPGGDSYWYNTTSILPFDGANGSTTFTDVKPKTWTLTDTVSIMETGDVGTVGRFDGGAISTNTSYPNFNFSSPFTAEFRIKADSIASNQVLLTSDGSAGVHGGHYLAIGAGGSVGFALRYDANPLEAGTELFSTTGLISAGTRHDLAYVYDGVDMRVYVDGALRWSVAIPSPVADPTNSGVTHIGRYYSGGSPFIGEIEKLRWTQAVRYLSDYTPSSGAFPIFAAPALDTLWGKISSLMHFEGANNSTRIINRSGPAWVTTGTAKISTALGDNALSLDGSGDIQAGQSPYFAYGTGDFSWELKLRLNSLTGNQYILDHVLGAGNGGTLSYNNGLRFYNASTGAGSALYTAAPALLVDTWYTIAYDRVGGTGTLRVNGVAVASATDSRDYPSAAAFIGVWGGGPTSGGNSTRLNGYIREFRITKGAARNTADYTPAVVAFPNS